MQPPGPAFGRPDDKLRVIRERPVRLAMPVPDYATEGGRSIRATLPSRTNR